MENVSNWRRLVVPAAKVLLGADSNAEIDTQVLFGETVKILEEDEQWARVRADLDGKEGWVQSPSGVFAQMSDTPSPTHWVTHPRVVVYREPNFKAAPVTVLSMNSLVAAGACELGACGEGQYTQVLGLVGAPQAWIPSDRLALIGRFAKDFVEEALKFIGIPYIWGTRDASPGIDCSAHLQQTLLACGVCAPRDARPQSQALGDELEENTTMQRGDLVFWTRGKGRHVAIMLDNLQCIHVTIAPPHRGVVTETLVAVALQQFSDGNGTPSVARRFPDYAFA